MTAVVPALILAMLPAAPAVAWSPAETAVPALAPVADSGPLPLAALGFLLIGLGFSALLLRDGG